MAHPPKVIPFPAARLLRTVAQEPICRFQIVRGPGLLCQVDLTKVQVAIGHLESRTGPVGAGPSQYVGPPPPFAAVPPPHLEPRWLRPRPPTRAPAPGGPLPPPPRLDHALALRPVAPIEPGPLPQALIAAPATRRNANAPATCSPRRYLRAYFRSRYRADGGPASTGSSCR